MTGPLAFNSGGGGGKRKGGGENDINGKSEEEEVEVEENPFCSTVEGKGFLMCFVFTHSHPFSKLGLESVAKWVQFIKLLKLQHWFLFTKLLISIPLPKEGSGEGLDRCQKTRFFSIFFRPIRKEGIEKKVKRVPDSFPTPFFPFPTTPSISSESPPISPFAICGEPK